jgi:predicted PhzF superfamily epimerase YddE/YHI9
MERHALSLVDTFADEPLGGLAVPVVSGAELTDGQLRRVAAEFDAPGAVGGADGLGYVARETRAPLSAAVAAGVALADTLEPGTHELETDDGSIELELDAGRRVTTSLEDDTSVADVDIASVADALGVPTAALSDVDLPVGRAEAAGGSLLVPVTFLENLGQVDPDPDSVADLPGRRMIAFTFDTVAAESDLHARVLDEHGREWATSPVAAAGCGRYLGEQAAFDGERDRLRVESGGYLDRPATVEVGVDGTVTGGGLVALEGEIAVPPAPDDDIVEL